MQRKQRFETLLDEVDITDLKPHLHPIDEDPDVRIQELVKSRSIDLVWSWGRSAARESQVF